MGHCGTLAGRCKTLELFHIENICMEIQMIAYYYLLMKMNVE